MADLGKETATLVPRIVFLKAKQLYEMKLYNQALEILRENSVRFDIYESVGRIEVNIPVPKKNQAFDKNRKGRDNYVKRRTKGKRI